MESNCRPSHRFRVWSCVQLGADFKSINLHLLWQFENLPAIPLLYNNLKEFFPNDQNTPKLFVPDKFNSSISMEVRSMAFPCTVMEGVLMGCFFHLNSLVIFLTREVSRIPNKLLCRGKPVQRSQPRTFVLLLLPWIAIWLFFVPSVVIKRSNDPQNNIQTNLSFQKSNNLFCKQIRN